MGIIKQSLKILLHENEWSQIRGKVLLVGRSTVVIGYQEIERLMSGFGLSAPPRREGLRATKYASEVFNVDDKDLFMAISDQIEQVDVLDISPYEGANVVADLNHPVPQELWGQYDFIYDSSVIDNLFNPAEALSNLARMLAPGGRLVGINVNSFYPGAMVSCHPEWFHGFFAVNDFADAKVYVTAQYERGSSRFDALTHLYRYKPTFTPRYDYDHFDAVVGSNGVFHSIAVAERGIAPLDEIRFPINLQYVQSSSVEDWSRRDFGGSNRPWVTPGDPRLFDRTSPGTPTTGSRFDELPHHTDHYVLLGEGF
jgi:SAM-dependent methyltransferase